MSLVRENLNNLSAPQPDEAFRQLAENIPTLCWVADADGYIVWYNRQWYDYTGKTPAEMAGWGWKSVHKPEDLPEILNRWVQAVSSAKPFEMVIPIIGKDGVCRPFLTRINPYFDERGVLKSWFGVNTDISLQRQAEDALAQSEARFRTIADSMPQIVWSATPDGLHNYHNARWCEYTGAAVGSNSGDKWLSFLHPDDQERAGALWKQSVESGAPYHCEYRLRWHTGDYRWLLARAQAERHASGRILQWYGTCTDIEDLVLARNVLQRSRDELENEVSKKTGERNLLATLVEKTDLMVMAINQNHDILAINTANAQEFERLYGVRPQIGDNLLALLEDKQECQEVVREGWRAGLAGRDTVFAAERGDPARARSHYEIKVSPLRDKSGSVIGAFQFVQDITARIRDQTLLAEAQESLRQAQKLDAMGQLTGGVAHDFNNLLTPILGTLDILQRRNLGGEREQRLISGALQSAERAKVLVQRLLAFARRQPLQSVSVDVIALIGSLTDLITSTIGPQISLVLDLAESLPFAKADQHQLELAILNLCLNARDAIGTQGLIQIAAALEIIEADEPGSLAAGEYIRVSVTDNGRGMDSATLARAIEPFFSTKGVGKGTGLGLSMAHGLASQLGGKLTITSTLDVGTTVCIWLPRSDGAVSETAKAGRSPNRAAQAGTVLLVDDEENIRSLSADMLSEMGFKVYEASSAESALAMVKDGLKPDFLITDHLMPGMTGNELAKSFQILLPQTKTLIVSGFAEADGIDPTFRCLRKPFVQGELLSAISS